MGIGIRKSMMKVKRKEAMQATLKARLSFAGSSSMARSALIWCFSSSSVLCLGEGEESDVGVDDGVDEELMARVVSQEKSLGLARETLTETMRPVMMAARLPVKNIGYRFWEYLLWVARLTG